MKFGESKKVNIGAKSKSVEIIKKCILPYGGEERGNMILILLLFIKNYGKGLCNRYGKVPRKVITLESVLKICRNNM